MQDVACAACVCWEPCDALFMHVLMVGTRERVQKQHSEGERHELIVFYARCSGRGETASCKRFYFSKNFLRYFLALMEQLM